MNFFPANRTNTLYCIVASTVNGTLVIFLVGPQLGTHYLPPTPPVPPPGFVKQRGKLAKPPGSVISNGLNPSLVLVYVQWLNKPRTVVPGF